MAEVSYEGTNSSTHIGTLKGDEVVISGVSGVFPASDNVREFMDNLYNKVEQASGPGFFSPPRTAAVVVTLRPDAVARGVTYKEVLANAKAKVGLQDLGIEGLACRPTAAGARIMVAFSKSAQEKDMVTKVDDYNNIKHPEMPKYVGKINGSSKFDAQFFRVTHWQATSMDPLVRKMMEHTFAAIFDSGINPLTLSGTKLGVFVGSSYSDIVTYNLYNTLEKNSFLLPGCSKTMLSNRISYWIDGKGPSYSIDQASASCYTCLEIAYRSIKSGECDAAIVGGGITVTHPILSLNLKKAGLLCMDGKTKCFDKDGDGYVRSEAINVIFIQRARDAKRIYAEIFNVKSKYFTRPDANFLPIREPEDIKNFLKEFYLEAKVCPDEVEYVEGSGSGIAEADGKELQAIGEFFGSKKPIKVGSLNSNMGNTDAASCVCALTKFCAAYQKGILPANLHYNNPQDHISVVREGKVQILTENTNFRRGFCAINHFSPMGPNYHILLKGHYKAKNNNFIKLNIPYIVPVSGRQDDCVNKILNTLKESPVDAEQIALLHNIFQHDIPGHTGRGYIILDTNESEKPLNLGQKFEWNSSGDTGDVWFLYSGMGSQWTAMGADLMRIPIFAASIERCHRLLETKGLDLIKIITDPDDKILDNIIHSFVGITAIQIGLTDMLKELGIVPNNIIGHSLGELGCAYADGCLTAEQTIMASYNRGIVSINTKVIRGSMAAVGLGYKDVKDLCPPGIEVACHNSSESSTLSGPADIMKQFVAELTTRGVFVKEVASSNIAYHSKYISDMGAAFLSLMKDVILHPKLRSSKWISTSVPQEHWESVKYASAEYFTNNTLNPVYFEEASSLIPNNAIVIEIAPHALLQAIMKRSHKECTHIPLTRRKHDSPVNYLLEAIGRMYLSGLNPKVNVLYPKVEFPVATETTILSDLVEWYHNETWPEKLQKLEIKQKMAAQEYIINIDDDEYSYFRGNVRNGLNILPESAVLVFVWQTLAMFLDSDYKQMSVKFENVKFYKEVIIQNKKPVRLHVTINRGSRIFEVTLETELISGGSIQTYITNTCNTENLNSMTNYETIVDRNNIYTSLASKGFSYRNEFQSLYSTNISRNKALIQWTGNWVTFLDGIIQMNLLSNDYEGISSPKFIDKIIIDIDKHKLSNRTNIDDFIYYEAELSTNLFEVTMCGGVVIEAIKFRNLQKPYHRKYTLPAGLVKITENIQLVASKKGSLDSLKWEEAPAFTDNHSSVEVSYAGLSLKDYDNIFNNDIDSTKYFGMDFSGYNYWGQRVMGIIRKGAIGKTVNADLDLLWPVPEHWTLEDAASVPLPYLQAYYCLAVKGNQFRNKKVFVNGGAGALAQAVIAICISMGCTVYTTVNSVDKKKFLLRLFPELKERNIGYSRDPDIRNVISNTKYGRCDIVINCCSGILRKAAMKCVGFFGTFLDLNPYDMKESEEFGMSYLIEGREYKHVNISEIFKEENLKEKILLQKLISEGIVNGEVRPLSRVSYPPEDIQRAFGLLSHSKHRGRVLIRMKDIELSKIHIQPRLFLSSTSVYAVISQKAMHSVELISYFIKLGAKKFAVHIIDNVIGYLQAQLITWSTNRIEVTIHTETLRQIDDCKDFLKKSKTMGPIEGIFMLYDETVSFNQKNTTKTIIESLDLASREVCKELRYFAILGADTQNLDEDSVTHFGEKVCEVRKKLGLHAAVIYKRKYFEATLGKGYNKRLNGIKQLLYDLEINLRFENIDIESKLKTEMDQQYEINYLIKLTKILGLDAINKNLEELRIKEFNLSETKYEEIKTLVKENYFTNLRTEELKEMTLACLINLGKRSKASQINIRSGMGAFYTYIEENEYIASEPNIVMKTKCNTCDENEEEVDPDEPYLVMLPGYEGQHRVFKTISECLKVRAVTAQYNYEENDNTFQSIAASILKNLKRLIKFKSKFYLLGYSFGVNVALELAALLEQEGCIGIVFCLDSSPDALTVQTEAYLGNLSDNELENVLLTHIYKMATDQDEKDITNILIKCRNWQEKVNAFISLIKNMVSYTHQYLKYMVEGAYRRLKIGQTYKPDIKLKSELILLKGIPHPKATGLVYDYNLSKYTEEEVKVFDIDSDHTSILQDCKVASIVNSTLDPKILQEFEIKNKCEFYYKV